MCRKLNIKKSYKDERWIQINCGMLIIKYIFDCLYCLCLSNRVPKTFNPSSEPNFDSEPYSHIFSSNLLKNVKEEHFPISIMYVQKMDWFLRINYR